jgi:quinoprotein glucose dehydrogenase
MKQTSRFVFGLWSLAVIGSAIAVFAQTGTLVRRSLAEGGLVRHSLGDGAEWRTYGSDLASTRYSPLDQINAKNFNQLEVAFRFRTESRGPRPQ